MNRLTEYTGLAGIDEQTALGVATEQDRPTCWKRHDRWHERVPASLANDDWDAVLDVCYEAMGGSQIDADASSH
jgi:hypothetical protein